MCGPGYPLTDDCQFDILQSGPGNWDGATSSRCSAARPRGHSRRARSRRASCQPLGVAKMSDAQRLLFLRIALIIIGLTFIFGIYTLGVFWPSGWAWGQGHSHYLMMIIGVYATLGVFLLIASRNPYAHKSLIWFTVWSSVVHGAIMGVQALSDPAERGHLVGDVPALILVAIILAVLMPRGLQKVESGPRTVPT